MRRPTPAELDAAAATLAALARVPSLRHGVALFRAEDLAGGWPLAPGGPDDGLDLDEWPTSTLDSYFNHVWTPIPAGDQDEGELYADCLRKLTVAMDARQRRVESELLEYRARGRFQEDIDGIAGYLYEPAG